MTLHNVTIPQGYAKVTIDNILKKKYNKILLDHPPEKDKPTLGDNRGGFVAWRKRYIKFHDQEPSSDDDETPSSSPPRPRSPCTRGPCSPPPPVPHSMPPQS